MVMTLIALLMTLLMPSIQAAMRLVDRAKCISQLNTMGTAMHAYWHENDVWPRRAKVACPFEWDDAMFDQLFTRFLTEPQLISKGRPHLILALHRAGRTPDEIREITGVARKTIDGYVTHFTTGTQAEGFDDYIGKDLSTAELCQMLGTWHAKHGSS
jgi:type II secretory pathway pseudopilin PulG